MYVEWGGYENDRLKDNIVLDIPQPIIVQYKLNWNNGDALKNSSYSAFDTIPLNSYYYFGALAQVDAKNGNTISASVSQASDFIDDTIGNPTYMHPLSVYGVLQDGFEALESSFPTTYPTTLKTKQTIVFIYIGKEYSLTYDANTGQFPLGTDMTSSPTNDIVLSSRYMEPFPDINHSFYPTKRASVFTGDWSIVSNASPDTAVSSGDIIDYTRPVNASTPVTQTRHTTIGDMTAYAVWERTDWELYFDPNGGNFTYPDAPHHPYSFL